MDWEKIKKRFDARILLVTLTAFVTGGCVVALARARLVLAAFVMMAVGVALMLLVLFTWPETNTR